MQFQIRCFSCDAVFSHFPDVDIRNATDFWEVQRPGRWGPDEVPGRLAVSAVQDPDVDIRNATDFWEVQQPGRWEPDEIAGFLAVSAVQDRDVEIRNVME